MREEVPLSVGFPGSRGGLIWEEIPEGRSEGAGRVGQGRRKNKSIT